MSARALLLCIPLATCVLSAAAAQDSATTTPGVTIYRCVNAQGAIALRDSPCGKGERQEVRSMQRPRDPAPAAASAAPVARNPAVAPTVRERVVYRTPPRPLYECITAEGDTYTSESGEGNPRWVPYWIPSYAPYAGHHYGGGASVTGNVSVGRGNLSFSSGGPVRVPPTPPLVHPTPGAHVVLPAGGAWVRDTCHPLPQQEVCSRMSDRRYEILRRYTNAMPSERRTLDLEQRDIDARLANDCGDS